MTCEEWQQTVACEIREDALWRSEVYRLALFSSDLAWRDLARLMQDKRTLGLVDHLYRSIGSISSNFAEGYSRHSGKDQARFYEDAPGSAREARNWYYHCRHVLPENVHEHRLQLLTQIIRLLLRIIPVERGYTMKEEGEACSAVPSDLLTNAPTSDFDTQHAIRNTK